MYLAIALAAAIVGWSTNLWTAESHLFPEASHVPTLTNTGLQCLPRTSSS